MAANATVVARPAGPGLQAAQRVVDAAERAAAAGHTALSWAELRQWPVWASGEPVPMAWLQRLGACWHAAELQRCIDGARLNALRDELGEAGLQAVLRLPAAGASPQPLNSNDSTARWLEQLAADGRAVALASLTSPALRQAVAAVLGWRDSAAPLAPAQVQAWLHAVQA